MRPRQPLCEFACRGPAARGLDGEPESRSKIIGSLSAGFSTVKCRMPLTLRRSRLETSPVYAHLADDTIFEDETAIGRTFERRPPAPPDGAWTWSIFALGPGRGHVKTHGRSPTFEDAKAQCRELGGVQGRRPRLGFCEATQRARERLAWV
jgi:hypothetical protein